MTAGAQSSQPSLRSARAPSDSCLLWPAGRCSAAAPAVTSVLVLIGLFLPRRPAGSWHQALRLEPLFDLALHGIQRGLRADRAGGRDQVRDVDGDDLVDRRLRADAGVLQRR